MVGSSVPVGPSARAPRWRRLAVGTLAATGIAVAVILLITGQGTRAAAPSGWNIVTSPGTGGDDVALGSACANASECWSVGVSIANINSNATFGALIQAWDGRSWALEPSPAQPANEGSGLFGVTCAASSDCWAVGTVLGAAGNPAGTLTEHWDGASWVVVPSPVPNGSAGGILQGVSCVSLSDCWAVGYTTDSNGGPLNVLAERWNGSGWSIIPTAPSGQTFDQLTSVSCLGSSDCWAVGTAGPAQQNPNFLPIFPGAAGDQGLIEHWDGNTWSTVTSYTAPNPEGSYLSHVTCLASSDCWASGSTTDSSGSASGTLMERWNGSLWSLVTTPNPANTPGSILAGVSCLDAAHCWAVGSAGTFGGGGGSGFQPESFIEAWNGSTWSIQPSPNVTAVSFLNSISCQSVECWAVGSAITNTQGNDPGLRSLIEQMLLPPATNQGFRLSARDGGIFTFGDAAFYGSMGAVHLNRPVVGLATTPDGHGYWEVAADGGIFTFGDAAFYGSMGAVHLNQPVVGLATTPDGHGYWEVAADGGIFTFGDAAFYGSMGAVHLNRPVVGLATTPDGHGYWEVAADGGIFTFGDAAFYGSMGAVHLNQPVVGLATTPDGHGYWEVAADGGIFTFGDAAFYGSVPGQGIRTQHSIVGIGLTANGQGYWLVSSDGSVFAYGQATYLGSLGGIRLSAPISGIAP